MAEAEVAADADVADVAGRALATTDGRAGIPTRGAGGAGAISSDPPSARPLRSTAGSGLGVGPALATTTAASTGAMAGDAALEGRVSTCSGLPRPRPSDRETARLTVVNTRSAPRTTQRAKEFVVCMGIRAGWVIDSAGSSRLPWEKHARLQSRDHILHVRPFHRT